MAFALEKTAVYEVKVEGRNLNQLNLNIWHFSGNEDPAWPDPVSDSQELLTQIRTEIVTNLVPLQHTQLTYQRLVIGKVSGYQVTGTQLRPTFSLTDEQSLAGVQGTSNGVPMPSYVGVTGQKKTNTPGRRYKGSARLGGVIEADTDLLTQANFLTAAALAAWQAAWTDIAAASFATEVGGGNTIRMGVFSLTDMAANNPPGPVANAAAYWHRNSTAPVNPYVGSQVSRKFGHGV